MSNNNNNMIFWKKSLFPLCSFSISKCLPTATPHSPRHHLSDDEQNDDDRSYQTTNPSWSYNSTSLSSIPSFATKNFNALYADLFTTTASSSSVAATTDDDDDAGEADFAAVFASQRFFFSSPGRSNSITESRDAGRPPLGARRRRTASLDVTAGSVEVRKYSVDPRVDFRRSMQEMIEARSEENDDQDDRSDLEYLHELLLCFLALNPKDTHKFVISAFTDIVVDLLSSSSSSSSSENNARRHREAKIRRKRTGLRRLGM